MGAPVTRKTRAARSSNAAKGSTTTATTESDEGGSRSLEVSAAAGRTSSSISSSPQSFPVATASAPSESSSSSPLPPPGSSEGTREEDVRSAPSSCIPPPTPAVTSSSSIGTSSSSVSPGAGERGGGEGGSPRAVSGRQHRPAEGRKRSTENSDTSSKNTTQYSADRHRNYEEHGRGTGDVCDGEGFCEEGKEGFPSASHCGSDPFAASITEGVTDPGEAVHTSSAVSSSASSVQGSTLVQTVQGADHVDMTSEDSNTSSNSSRFIIRRACDNDNNNNNAPGSSHDERSSSSYYYQSPPSVDLLLQGQQKGAFLSQEDHTDEGDERRTGEEREKGKGTETRTRSSTTTTRSLFLSSSSPSSSASSSSGGVNTPRQTCKSEEVPSLRSSRPPSQQSVAEDGGGGGSRLPRDSPRNSNIRTARAGGGHVKKEFMASSTTPIATTLTPHNRSSHGRSTGDFLKTCSGSPGSLSADLEEILTLSLSVYSTSVHPCRYGVQSSPTIFIRLPWFFSSPRLYVVL